MKRKKNRKVKNATIKTVDGIKFKSKLEAHCYNRLKENNIKAEYEGKKFEIIPAFIYNNEKVRKMTYTPDFVGTYKNKKFVIECKGNPNDAFPLRWKIFKYYLYNTRSKYDLYLPRSMKQVDETVEKIKNNGTNLHNSKNDGARRSRDKGENKGSQKGNKKTEKKAKNDKKMEK